MPMPPPSPEVIDNKVVDAKSAQKHRQHMEALESQRQLKELDVRWYKTRAHEAKRLIQAGHVDDAIKVLDDMASRKRGSHPGTDLTSGTDSQ
jgi:3-mercaptopyruvate sulfurtransferase SseA